MVSFCLFENKKSMSWKTAMQKALWNMYDQHFLCFSQFYIKNIYYQFFEAYF